MMPTLDHYGMNFHMSNVHYDNMGNTIFTLSLLVSPEYDSKPPLSKLYSDMTLINNARQSSTPAIKDALEQLEMMMLLHK